MLSKNIAHSLSFVSAAMGSLLFVRNRTPSGFPLWGLKVLSGALSPYLAAAGTLGAVLGLCTRAPVAILMGVAGAWASARYVWRVVTSSGGFDGAFSAGWRERLPQPQAVRMLKGRWTWRAPAAPEPRWARDVVFWTLPDSGRELLCDVWQPPTGVEPSGLAILYFHGSAWYMLDKDFGTRPFFRHLAGQGHTIVDVAYRLCPEVDLCEMVGDVKRAVAWIKANAAQYGVDPDRVVLGGGSAGAHIALLGAYTRDEPELTPAELQDEDLSVRAVFSYYGPTDMRAMFDYNVALQHPTGPGARSLPVPAPPRQPWREWMRYQGEQSQRSANTAVDLLGGLPEEVPHMYDLASPVHHVHAGCPPTMLIQGEDEMIVPVEATRALHRKLLAAGVPVVYLELPQTEYAFDLFLPRTSPPAQVALYDLERFLALMV